MSKLKKQRKAKGVYELHSHAATRLKERYEFENAWDAAEQITRLIRSNKAVFLHRESATRTHWLVDYDGKQIIAVYHKPLKFICTVLRNDVLSSYGRDLPVLREQHSEKGI